MKSTSFARTALIATAAAMIAAGASATSASAKPRSADGTTIKINVAHTPTIKHDRKRDKLVISHRHSIKRGKKTVTSSRTQGYSIDCKTIKLGKLLDCGALSSLF